MLTELDPLNDEKSLLRLVRFSGADVDVVNSARVSYNKKVSEMSDKDKKLMRFLIEHRHETPFEHNQLVFEVTAPIFVFREWHRHRVGWSYNEWSMRYLAGGEDVDLEFYTPIKLRRQSKSNRQASDGEFFSEEYFLNINSAYSHSYAVYRKLLADGVAKELARIVLPVGMYSSMWATCNLRSLMHFLELRLDSAAQFEIREYAKGMLKLAEQHFPVTMSLWRELHGYNSDGEKG